MKTRMTVIIGGARWPEGVRQSDDTLFQIAASRVAAWAGVDVPCSEHRIIRSVDAIPQPSVGHRRLSPYRLSSCKRICAIGPSIGGVSVKQCINSGYAAATAEWLEEG
jgi:protoporphyrinogen oxidase